MNAKFQNKKTSTGKIQGQDVIKFAENCRN